VKVMVLHLSDLHIRRPVDVLLKRTEQIAGAVQAVCTAEPELALCLLVVTGDIAFSGAKEEYALAQEFFTSLRTNIAALRDNLRVEEVFIPGNHDCHFGTSSARDIVRKHAVETYNDLSNPDESVVTVCAEVQDEFFRFMASRTGELAPLSGSDRLRYSRKIAVDNKTICVQCINSAWLSTMHEKRGELLAPTWIDVPDIGYYDYVITMVHHPFSWMRTENAQRFRSQVEESSQFCLSGHEHVPHAFLKDPYEGSAIQYYEGAVLQDGDDESNSGFYVLVLDTSDERLRVRRYAWSADYYNLAHDSDWQAMRVAKHSDPNSMPIREEFQRYLANPGTGFIHPRKGELAFRDIFVYPDIDDVSITRKGGLQGQERIVRGPNLTDSLLSARRVVIVGDDVSGKTALAKALFSDLLGARLSPVYVRGEELKGFQQLALARFVKKSVEEQYGGRATERYLQLKSENRALIIDDIHLASLNRKAMAALLEEAAGTFSVIVAFADALFHIGEFLRDADDAALQEDVILSFKSWKIREFGFQLRGSLIERWLKLGQDYTIAEREYAVKIEEAESLINNILGRSILPSYPIFILTILQTLEGNKDKSGANSSIGFYYQALIRATLNRENPNITPDTLDTLLSSIAYRQFCLGRKHLREEELRGVVEEYQKAYAMPMRTEEVLRLLSKASIYDRSYDGAYRFFYAYLYSYFVAQYISNHLHSANQGFEMRALVGRLIQSLHVDDRSDILIFLVYLTRDEWVVNSLVTATTQMLADYPPCDMHNVVSHLGLTAPASRPIKIQQPGHTSNRREMRQTLDDMAPESNGGTDEEHPSSDDANGGGGDEIDEAIAVMGKVTTAFKMLQILGQILRNSPGALPGSTKLEVIEGAYKLGLRALQSVYVLLHSDTPALTGMLEEMLRLQHSNIKEDELERRVNESLYVLTLMIGYAFVKKVSQAVGSEQLNITYSVINERTSNAAIRLIDTSIRLDHFRQFPMDDLEEAHKQLLKHPFSLDILRHLIAEHLLLFPVDRPLRQRVSAQFSISIKDPKMITGRDRLR